MASLATGKFPGRPGAGRWPRPGVSSGMSSDAVASRGGGIQAREPAVGWTVVLRRRPVRIVGGRAEGGYTDAFELICCNCGDHPGLDHREVSAELQRIRGPYLFAAGIAAYEEHVQQYHRVEADSPASRPRYATSGPTDMEDDPDGT